MGTIECSFSLGPWILLQFLALASRSCKIVEVINFVRTVERERNSYGNHFPFVKKHESSSRVSHPVSPVLEGNNIVNQLMEAHFVPLKILKSPSNLALMTNLVKHGSRIMVEPRFLGAQSVKERERVRLSSWFRLIFFFAQWVSFFGDRLITDA